jgi:hypothetical protein
LHLSFDDGEIFYAAKKNHAARLRNSAKTSQRIHPRRAQTVGSSPHQDVTNDINGVIRKIQIALEDTEVESAGGWPVK